MQCRSPGLPKRKPATQYNDLTYAHKQEKERKEPEAKTEPEGERKN